MILIKCTDFDELIAFLKLDYVNNLYFFTYLYDFDDPLVDFFIAKHNGKIVLALLIAPIHCCVSSSNIQTIDAVADQLPPIKSIHVVGRSDLVARLLQFTLEIKRYQHVYSLCKYILPNICDRIIFTSQYALKSDLQDLVSFYESNNMLIGSENRIPAILSWGTISYIRRNRQIVSCALTTTETDESAMIGAVYTNPEYRNKGYAKDCILNLCGQLLSKNKLPYLFYRSDDILLRELYGSLGFCQNDTWILATDIDY